MTILDQLGDQRALPLQPLPSLPHVALRDFEPGFILPIHMTALPGIAAAPIGQW